jgi:hypothetical protein
VTYLWHNLLWRLTIKFKLHQTVVICTIKCIFYFVENCACVFFKLNVLVILVICNTESLVILDFLFGDFGHFWCLIKNLISDFGLRPFEMRVVKLLEK